MIIHCSAGVGRTGTFIALDILTQRMQNEKKINIYDTVKSLRKQRVKMVQTLQQYTFLYDCCLQLVKGKGKRGKYWVSIIDNIQLCAKISIKMRYNLHFSYL